MADVTTAQVFEFLINAQQGMTLRAARDLLHEVQSLVDRLEKGVVPVSVLNINTVGRVVTDHAKLLALKESLDIISKETK